MKIRKATVATLMAVGSASLVVGIVVDEVSQIGRPIGLWFCGKECGAKYDHATELAKMCEDIYPIIRDEF